MKRSTGIDPEALRDAAGRAVGAPLVSVLFAASPQPRVDASPLLVSRGLGGAMLAGRFMFKRFKSPKYVPERRATWGLR